MNEMKWIKNKITSPFIHQINADNFLFFHSIGNNHYHHHCNIVWQENLVLTREREKLLQLSRCNFVFFLVINLSINVLPPAKKTRREQKKFLSISGFRIIVNSPESVWCLRVFFLGGWERFIHLIWHFENLHIWHVMTLLVMNISHANTWILYAKWIWSHYSFDMNFFSCFFLPPHQSLVDICNETLIFFSWPRWSLKFVSIEYRKKVSISNNDNNYGS